MERKRKIQVEEDERASFEKQQQKKKNLEEEEEEEEIVLLRPLFEGEKNPCDQQPEKKKKKKTKTKMKMKTMRAMEKGEKCLEMKREHLQRD